MIDCFITSLIQKKIGRSGKYLKANSTRFYYEGYGRGEPLMMFHGGLSTLETFRFQVPELSKYYHLILPERRGHGHTPDTPGPYSYKQMAEDMASFMNFRGVKKAKMIGYSDGANLIFHLALQHPELIESCVLIGGNFHYEGSTAEHLQELRTLTDETMRLQGVDEAYARSSPDGAEHYWEVYKKIRSLWLSEPVFSAEDLKKISVPTLVMAGDHDIIRMDHTLAMFQSLHQAQLCILPGTTHRLMKEKPDLVNRVILKFLKEPIFVPMDQSTDSTQKS